MIGECRHSIFQVCFVIKVDFFNSPGTFPGHYLMKMEIQLISCNLFNIFLKSTKLFILLYYRNITEHTCTYMHGCLITIIHTLLS